MPFLGMDVDTVEAKGHELQHQGDAIRGVIGAVDGVIAALAGSWKGQDFQQFESWWNTQHKPALAHAADAVSGLGTSALNNAQQQRDTSAH